ncbi:MAG: hypothetical protein ACKO2G_06550 [Verrucomicrobiales bacterium]
MTPTILSCESFACPHCRIELRLRPGMAMVSGPCSSCGGRIEAPSPTPEPRLDTLIQRVKLPPRRAPGQRPMAWSDEAPAPPAERVRLTREVAPMPERNNFGSQRPGDAARRRREQSRRAIWKNLLSLTVSTILIFITGAAVLNAFEKKAETAPEPAAFSPGKNTSSASSPEATDDSLATLQN